MRTLVIFNSHSMLEDAIHNDTLWPKGAVKYITKQRIENNGDEYILRVVQNMDDAYRLSGYVVDRIIFHFSTKSSLGGDVLNYLSSFVRRSGK